MGHDVTVVTVKYPGLKEFETHHNVKIIRYNIATKHALYVGDIKGYRRLIEKLCKNADVLINVCTQTATTEVLYPILYKLPCKKSYICMDFTTFTGIVLTLLLFPILDTNCGIISAGDLIT